MLREISLAEVKKHNSEKSDWIVIHNEVYDVTKYLSEHPGGQDTLLEVAGQVATQSFEDIGHSNDAREIMKKYKIGALPANEFSITDLDSLKIGPKKKKPRDAESWSTAWNREYYVYPAKQSHHCCGPDDDKDRDRPCDRSCRNFDGSSHTDMCDCDEVDQKALRPPDTPEFVPPPVTPEPPFEPPLVSPSVPPPRTRPPPVAKSPSVPRIERRVNAIVVPRERTRRRPRPRRRSSIPPESGNWWKWALLLLAGAITVGLIMKKKMG